jgi:hypothetical protein
MKTYLVSNRKLLVIASTVVAVVATTTSPWPAVGGSHPALGIPQLHAGQKFVYRVTYQTDKVTRSESRVVTPLLPEGSKSNTQRLLSVEIKAVQGSGADARIAIHTQILPVDSSSRQATGDGTVDFTLLSTGLAAGVNGLDALVPEEQALWRQWIAQFALSWTFPPTGIKPGEKWRKDEPVLGSALARLTWDKQFEYVHDEACPNRGDNGTPSKSVGKCAVIVVTTAMKQHGSHDDATPDDYKAAQLKTSGTAQGKTQLVTFISLRSGFVERSTEDSAQAMDVLIAKADDSNKAHFNIEATSHSEVVLMQ